MKRVMASLALTLCPIADAAAVVDNAVMSRADRLIENAIAAKQIPGAVLLVGRGSSVVYRKAYGQRAVEPIPEPMTVDTIFDLASLTKPVATATAVMQLAEEGRLRLDDRVANHLPDFGRHGKDTITVRHLLTHVSGLRADLDLEDPWVGRDTAFELAAEEIPLSTPG
jgi:CubicO group peptidase (beta-lactamase class C family)